jgi:hypothetical protein
VLTRYELVGLPDRSQITDAVTVFWLFALGRAAAKARTTPHRLLVTLAALATIPGFFPGEPGREAFVLIGFVLLVWFPALPSHHRINQAAGFLAASSLSIYLTHWQIYPILDDISEPLSLITALLFGIAHAKGADHLTRRLPTLPRLAALRTGWLGSRRKRSWSFRDRSGKPAHEGSLPGRWADAL